MISTEGISGGFPILIVLKYCGVFLSFLISMAIRTLSAGVPSLNIVPVIVIGCLTV